MIQVLSKTMLLRMLRNRPIADNTLIAEVVDELNFRLPGNWRTEIDFEPSGRGRVADARLHVYAPDGTQAILDLEARRRVDPRDVNSKKKWSGTNECAGASLRSPMTSGTWDARS